MALQFRNLVVTPDAPVTEWGFEGVLAAVERGDVTHWRRIARALNADPRGKVAAEVDEVIQTVEDPGMAALFTRLAVNAVHQAEESERHQVAAELRTHLDASGLTRKEFARRLGTSPSRLSTYLNAKVVPSAVLLVRARGLAQRAH